MSRDTFGIGALKIAFALAAPDAANVNAVRSQSLFVASVPSCRGALSGKQRAHQITLFGALFDGPLSRHNETLWAVIADF